MRLCVGGGSIKREVVEERRRIRLCSSAPGGGE